MTPTPSPTPVVVLVQTAVETFTSANPAYIVGACLALMFLYVFAAFGAGDKSKNYSVLLGLTVAGLPIAFVNVAWYAVLVYLVYFLYLVVSTISSLPKGG